MEQMCGMPGYVPCQSRSSPHRDKGGIRCLQGEQRHRKRTRGPMTNGSVQLSLAGIDRTTHQPEEEIGDIQVRMNWYGYLREMSIEVMGDCVVPARVVSKSENVRNSWYSNVGS